MKKLIVITLALLLICGIALAKSGTPEKAAKELTIKWQKMVDKDGKTCTHCGATEIEMKKAMQMFEEKGVKVKLELVSLDSKDKAQACSGSNLIWLNDKPLADVIGAEVVKAKCSAKCAGHDKTTECKMLKVEGKTYETIPSEMIFHAGLKSMDMETAEAKPASETKMKGCAKSCAKTCGAAAAAACGKKKDK